MTVVHHLLCLLEIVGEMFVVVDWNSASVLLENLDTLLEKFVAWIENLPFLISWVVTMLTYEQHSIDSKFVSTAAQRFRNSRVHGKTELAGTVSGLVSFGFLIHIKRNDLGIGTMPVPLIGIADDEAVSEVLGM